MAGAAGRFSHLAARLFLRVRRKLGMRFCKRVGCLLQKPRVLGDVAGVARGLGIDRERKPRVKKEVALDAEAKPALDAFKFGKADAAEFRKAEAEIAKTEQRVAIHIEFAQKPGRRPGRIEQFSTGT